MNKRVLIGLVGTILSAQTATVYLSSSGPASVPIIGASNTTPVVIETYSAHGYSIGDIVSVNNICAGPNSGPNGTSWASAANGIRKVSTVPDSTHYAITDLSSTPIAGNGAYVPFCGSVPNTPAGAQWSAKVNPFTTVAQPTGAMDGPTGQVLTEVNSKTTSMSLSGCPSACVVTVGTMFNSLTLPTPSKSGDKVAIVGTSSTLLNSAIFPNTISPNTGIVYTMDTVTSGGFTTVPFAAALSNGTVTPNNHCGPTIPPNGAIGGTQQCDSVDLKAYPGNPLWDNNRFRATAFAPNMDSASGYKFLFDGGNLAENTDMSYFTYATMFFQADPTIQHYLDVLIYAWDHMERANGVNWSGNSLGSEGGTTQFNQGLGALMGSLSNIYDGGGLYFSPTSVSTGLDKIYNGIRDPNNISSTSDAQLASGHNYILATGVAQGGSGTSITLSAGDTQGSGYYVGTIIVAVVSGGNSYAQITGYNNTTKLATVPSWSNGAPGNGDMYTDYGAMTVSSKTQGATVTATGVHTTWMTDLVAGDAVIGYFATPDQWGRPAIQEIMSIVVSVTDDTHLQVINSTAITADTVVPTIVYNLKKWKTGDVGATWLGDFWSGAITGQPNINPGSGGTLVTANIPVPPTISEGGNNASIWCDGYTQMDFAAAANDFRAITNLASLQTFCWNYFQAHYFTYTTGNAHSGSAYNSETVWPGLQGMLEIFANSAQGFPDMGQHLQWMKDIARMRYFQIYPDFRFGGDGDHEPWPLRQANDNGDNQISSQSGIAFGYLGDTNFFFNPTDPATQGMYCLLKPVCNPLVGLDYWTSLSGPINPGTFLYTHQNQTYRDYTVDPPQYFFHTANPLCNSLTGWPCPSDFKGISIISRSDWTSHATLVFGGERTWFDDHDHPQNGKLTIYKNNNLITTDATPTDDAGDSGPSDTDESLRGDLFAIGGVNTSQCGETCNTYTPSVVPIWAGPNDMGDPAGQYTVWCANRNGIFAVAMNYYMGCVIHSKVTGGDEYVMRGDMSQLVSAQSMEMHTLYAQNSETGVSAYPEGTTSNPTGRIIVSVEDGNTYNGVVQQYGITSDFNSPNTDYWIYDGTTYPTSQGHAERVSQGCGVSQGTAVTTCNVFRVDKIMQTLGDTTFNRSWLNPDSNWYGVQAQGAISPAVMLMPLNGVTHNSIASFSTTHTGTAQYVFAGLDNGGYTVQVNGVTVFSKRVTDNVIEFLSTAGTVVVTNGIEGNFQGGTQTVGGSVTKH